MIYQQLLAESFDTYLGADPSVKESVVESSMLYSFQGINLSQFNKAMRPIAGSRVIDYRMALTSNGRVFQSKAYMYRAYCKDDLNGTFVEAALSPQDRNLKKWVFTSDKLCTQLEKFAASGYKPVSWPKLQAAIVDNLKSARTYAAYKTTKDLAFVTRAGQTQKDDLIDELVLSSIQAVYKMYPRIEGRKHMLNIMKRAITNSCTNLQYHHSRQCRKAMHEEKDANGQIVYRNIMQKIDLIPQEHPNLCVTETPETGLALTQLLERYTGKHRYYIELASGKYDLTFSEWLNDRGFRMTNDVLFDEMFAEDKMADYCTLAALFLRLPEGAIGFNRILQRDLTGASREQD